jgi:hypothetical protein
MSQLGLDLDPRWDDDRHEHSGFITMAVVPCGFYCDTCHTLIEQYVPQPPSVLGYVGADWEYMQRAKAEGRNTWEEYANPKPRPVEEL